MMAWRDKISVALGKHQVGLVRISHGLRPRISNEAILPCGAVTQPRKPWLAAIEVLRDALARPQWQGAQVDVVLSNAFVRYGLVRSPAANLTTDEVTTLARHFFHKVFGEAADGWVCRTDELERATLLTTAVEQELVDELKRLIKAPANRLCAIQPLIVPVINECRHILEKQSGYLVIIEKGLLVIATLEQGSWTQIVARHVDTSRDDAILACLAQSAALAQGPYRHLFLFSAGEIDMMIFKQWEAKKLVLPKPWALGSDATTGISRASVPTGIRTG